MAKRAWKCGVVLVALAGVSLVRSALRLVTKSNAFTTALGTTSSILRQSTQNTSKQRNVSFSNCVVEQPQTKRIAICLIGEALRDSHRQLDRGTCSPGSAEAQRVAAANQLQELVGPMESAGYEVDMFGVTYPCSNGSSVAEFLHSVYAGRFVALNATFPKHSRIWGPQIYSMRESVKMVIDRVDSGRSEPYEQMMFFRFDVFLKSPFDADCTLKNPNVVARDGSNIRGWETKFGITKINVDFVHLIPGAFIHCFHLLTRDRPDECCIPNCLGMSCTMCMNKLNEVIGVNQSLAPTTGCPEESFLQAKVGSSERDKADPKPWAGRPRRCYGGAHGRLQYQAKNGTWLSMEDIL